jgi:hypothetical protein
MSFFLLLNFIEARVVPTLGDLHLIISVTAPHMLIPMEKLALHNYIRELYLIPIILAGIMNEKICSENRL